jgi:putative hemolysin
LKDFYRIVNVNETLFEAKKGEAETLAGFILEILALFPRKGQKIAFDNCMFTVESVDKKRIKQIKVQQMYKYLVLVGVVFSVFGV